MRLAFLGVRGSTSAPGPEFVRYGGHTSCVAITLEGQAAPTLVLDAGTGLRSLSGMLGGAAFRGTILLTHLHWDHVWGLPFFFAGDHPDAIVTVHAPAQDGMTGEELLRTSMAPPAFPIGPDGLRGSWTFHATEPGPVAVDAFRSDGPGDGTSSGDGARPSRVEVTATEITHKGGRTYGYVVSADGVRVAYLPDHAPALGLTDDTLEAIAGVDLLIHGGQMLSTERAIADLFGHATVDDALELADRVGAGSVVLTHHSPGRIDDRLDELAAALGPRATLARDGLTIDLPPSR